MPGIKNRLTNREAGVSLIETLIALTLLAAFGAAVVYLLVTIQSINNSAKNKSRANAFAQEGIEQARAYLQDKRFVTMYDKIRTCNSGCFENGSADSTCLVSSCISSTTPCDEDHELPIPGAATFSRSVNFTPAPDSTNIKVESWVAWREKGMCRKASAVTYFYNY